MYLSRRFYIVFASVILIIAGGYLYAPLFWVGQWLVVALLVAVIADVALLYHKQGIRAERRCAERFSNGDDNSVHIRLESSYSFPVKIEVIDETPPVFQQRNISFRTRLPAGMSKTIRYHLCPTTRGVYEFGFIRVFAAHRLGLVLRRYTCGMPQNIKVYPSYLMLRQYELLAISNNLTELGIKRIRRIANHTEFEQIKGYVPGDDYRTINWQASARRHELMVNVFQDERSQQIYNVIDKGRVMQQAFRDMTLLDYAINASLVLSYVAIRKDDKAGLITFDEHFDSFVSASKQSGQMQTLQENLYAQTTTFGETDFSALCVHIEKHVTKRSLLVLYTNFAGMGSLHRQLPYLKRLNRRHYLLVVFFEDADLKNYIDTPPDHSTEAYYRHVIAEKFAFEQRLIAGTLKQYGIFALLTTPQNLSIDVINKYLEMKNRVLR